MPFWTIFMILGITAETTQLIKAFALAPHEEFKTPSFLFNYIIGPVNKVLQKYREHTQNNKKVQIITLLAVQESKNCSNLT